MEYQTVFEITEKGFPWWFPSVGLFGVIGGILIFKFNPGLVWWNYRKLLSYWMIGFGLFWSLGAFGALYSVYHQLHTAYETGQFSVVEGLVEDFHPMPWEGHVDESFTVKGVRFSYSDYGLTPGFNNTSSYGGPVREGLRVRVSYLNEHILKLEVSAEDFPLDVATQAAKGWAWSPTEEEILQSSWMDKSLLTFLFAVTFVCIWMNFDWQRYIRLWVSKRHSENPRVVIAFRIIVAVFTLVSVGSLVRWIFQQTRPSGDYLEAALYGLAWWGGSVLVVVGSVWLKRRREVGIPAE